MSQHLDGLAVGDTIDVRGPVGDVEYRGKGQLSYRDKPLQVSRINMMGGGTGITPLFQVVKVSAVQCQCVQGLATALLFGGTATCFPCRKTTATTTAYAA